MNAQQVDRTEEEFEEYLREAYGDVIICGVSCDAADALKVVDEVAFNQKYTAFNQTNRPWECTKCDTVFNDKDEAEECCEDITNAEFDKAFLGHIYDVTDKRYMDDIAHNDLNATHRSTYSAMIDNYQKDGDISLRQAENFTFNGDWD